MRNAARRRWKAPEVIQTSAMDCGPAGLKCLLEGFGIPVSYDRLREACQTGLDGTSIDTLEEVAVELGLLAEQVLVPRELLEDREAGLVPALAVTKLAGGHMHFVVIWRRHGDSLAIMDPSQGRRNVAVSAFLSELHEHSMEVPGEDWREWAGTDEFIGPLRRRLIRLGLQPAESEARVALACSDPSWQRLAVVDAAVRMVERLLQAKAIARADVPTVLDRMVEEAMAALASGDDVPIPQRYWSARLSADPEQLVIRGAVLVKVSGRREQEPAEAASDAEDDESPSVLSPELQATLRKPPVSPLRELWTMLRQDGLLLPGALTFTALVAGAGVLLEAVLFRALLDLVADLASTRQRLWGTAALVAFVSLLLAVQLPSVHGWLRTGRRLELQLRQTFLQKLPRIPERFFESRLASDMAERAHAVHTVRSVPVIGGSALMTAFSLLFTLLGVLWLDLTAWPWALALCAVSVGMPWWIQRRIRDDDMTFRTRAGALARHYLDALLGIIPIRTHGAQGTVWREHQGQLREWLRAGKTVQARAVVLGGFQTAVAFGLAAALLYDHLTRGGSAGAVLLLVYWALQMPVLGEQLTQFLLQYPQQRNVTARLLEPVGAAKQELEDSASEPVEGLGQPMAHSIIGVDVALHHVAVRAGGHTILEDITCQLRPGEHVAVVGRSGAGKSSLAGLLLGLHTPAAGDLLVDGEPLQGQHLLRLRQQTAWLDPAVSLWNRSFVDNLTYGSALEHADGLGSAIHTAELQELLEHLPEGLQTSLGEAGAFVSGGEGQRIRLGRALLRSDARLVILDEPFRGLDRAMRRTLLDRARRRWSHATLVCITHDLADTLEFSRVLVVHDGHIVEDGSPTDLAAQSDSQFADLLRNDTRVAELWNDARWRRLHVERGRVRCA